MSRKNQSTQAVKSAPKSAKAARAKATPNTASKTRKPRQPRTPRTATPAAAPAPAPTLFKVIVDTKALLSKISPLGRICIQRSNYFGGKQVLEYVEIHAADGKLTVRGTDLLVSARVTIDQVDVQRPGKVAVPAHLLIDAIKRGTGPTVTLELVKVPVEGAPPDELLAVRSSEGLVNIRTAPIEELPVWPTLQADYVLTLQAAEFGIALDEVAYAVANEQSRYAINGILFSAKSDRLRLAATDGRRLAITEFPIKGKCGDFIVPVKALDIIKKLMDTEEITLGVNLKRETPMLSATGLGWELVLNLVEGAFPPFEDVIPKDQPIQATINGDQLAAGVRHAAVVCEEQKAVRLRFAGKKVSIGAKDQPGDSDVECELENFKGEAITIGVNSKFVTDALSRIGNTGRIGLRGPNKPLRFDNPTTGAVHVLMPVNLS